MKRDMELVRKILLAMEEHEDSDGDMDLDSLGATDATIHYHLHLLYQGGLIDAIDASAAGGYSYIPQGLTWDGHEFLDDIRDEKVWNKAKAIVTSQVSSVSLEILREVAKQAIKTLLPLPLS